MIHSLIPITALCAIALVSYTPTYPSQMCPSIESEDGSHASYGWRGTLDAIRQVETGGLKDGGIGATGDNGNALGPYQIWKPYHMDGAARDKTLTRYMSCLVDKAYSERVVRAYMNRYCRKPLLRLEAGKGTILDVERISRIHNGGPRANRPERLKLTDGYWIKIRREL